MLPLRFISFDNVEEQHAIENEIKHCIAMQLGADPICKGLYGIRIENLQKRLADTLVKLNTVPMPLPENIRNDRGANANENAERKALTEKYNRERGKSTNDAVREAHGSYVPPKGAKKIKGFVYENQEYFIGVFIGWLTVIIVSIFLKMSGAI